MNIRTSGWIIMSTKSVADGPTFSNSSIPTPFTIIWSMVILDLNFECPIFNNKRIKFHRIKVIKCQIFIRWMADVYIQFNCSYKNHLKL